MSEKIEAWVFAVLGVSVILLVTTHIQSCTNNDENQALTHQCEISGEELPCISHTSRVRWNNACCCETHQGTLYYRNTYTR